MCNTDPKRYTVLKKVNSFSSFTIRLNSKGKYYFWDSRGRWPGKKTPSQTADPYDQYWPSCQWGEH